MSDIEQWLSVESGLPDDGVCMTRVIGSDGQKFEAKRKLRNGHWFGGCRPFTDGEKITHYRPVGVTDEMKEFGNPAR